MEIVFATNNHHKLEEVRQILGNNFKLLTLQDIDFNEEIEETESTFEGNALLKAQIIYEKFKLPCFSDDSGLEVEALDNAPGVYSARYAGDHGNHEKNMDKLLRELDDKTNRKARFRTILCYINTDGKVNYFNGIINGVIAHERRGMRGFGYDPVFIPDGYELSFAEMTPGEKNKISHRALAVQELLKHLQK